MPPSKYGDFVFDKVVEQVRAYVLQEVVKGKALIKVDMWVEAVVRPEDGKTKVRLHAYFDQNGYEPDDGEWSGRTKYSYVVEDEPEGGKHWDVDIELLMAALKGVMLDRIKEGNLFADVLLLLEASLDVDAEEVKVTVSVESEFRGKDDDNGRKTLRRCTHTVSVDDLVMDEDSVSLVGLFPNKPAVEGAAA